MSYVTDARPLTGEAYPSGYALSAFNSCSLELATGGVQATQGNRHARLGEATT